MDNPIGTVKGIISLGKQIGKLFSELPQLSEKLKYVFGEATGTLENINKSKGNLKLLERIGIENSAEGRTTMRRFLGEQLNNIEAIPAKDGKVARISQLIGPDGTVNVWTIWRENNLITIHILPTNVFPK